MSPLPCTPTLHCLALNKPLKPDTSTGFATGGVSVPQIGAVVVVAAGVGGFCFIFFFPLEVQFLKTATKTSKIKKNRSLG